jgi:hypothetical protein
MDEAQCPELMRPMACELLVKNGLLIDGTGAPARRRDACCGPDFRDLDQTKVLWALTPGAMVVSWRRTSEGSRRVRPQQRDSRRASGYRAPGKWSQREIPRDWSAQ